MRLRNEVRVPADPDTLFELLLDIQRIAPCLPGGALEGRDGDAYTGTVKTKVGPITASYRGTVRFQETDNTARHAVLIASGTEQNGSGNAAARVQAQVTPDGNGSVVSLDTDLVIRGRVAQFGRGVLGDVSARLLEQFAQNIQHRLLDGDEHAAQPAEEHTHDRSGEPTGSPAPPLEPAALDGLVTVVLPLLKRAGPILGAFVAGVVLHRLVRTKCRKRGRFTIQIG